jgi:hypothetical protein
MAIAAFPGFAIAKQVGVASLGIEMDLLWPERASQTALLSYVKV